MITINASTKTNSNQQTEKGKMEIWRSPAIAAIVFLLVLSSMSETVQTATYYQRMAASFDQNETSVSTSTASAPSLIISDQIAETFTMHNNETSATERRPSLEMAASANDHNEISATASPEDASPSLMSPTNKNQSASIPVELFRAKERNIMYIHIGKTGGTSLDLVFPSNCRWYGIPEARSNCFQNLYKSNTTVAPSLIKSTMHWWPKPQNNRWIGRTTSFLFSLRSPVSRSVSAFDFDHVLNNEGKQPRKRNIFYSCFPTAEHLALSLNATTNPNKKLRCDSMGINTLKGTPGGALDTNLAYNIGKYLNYTTLSHPNNEVMVIRTEHLWSDLSNLDTLLGGSGDYSHAKEKHFDHGSSNFTVKSKLTKDGRQLLCGALKEEIAIYKDLVMRASNLQEWEKQETMEYLKKDCGGIDV